MTFDTAKEILTREFHALTTSHDFDEIVIDFMGGEPTIQFPLIQKIAEWIWDNPPPKPFILFMTTNGTLFDDEMKRWWRANARRFFVGLSLDGTSIMQKANRGCSIADIDLDFFVANWPTQGVKMTISPDTLPSLAQGIIALQEKGFSLSANFAFGIDWNIPGVLDLFSDQLQRLGQYYLDHPEIEEHVLLDLRIETALNDNHPARRWCGTGKYMVSYDVDGKPYPCQMFTPLVLTEDEARRLTQYEFDSEDSFEDPKCRDCPGRFLCRTCYGFSYKAAGDPAVRDEALCRLFKVQLLENCRFQMSQLTKNDDDFTASDCIKAKALLKVHRSLTGV